MQCEFEACIISNECNACLTYGKQQQQYHPSWQHPKKSSLMIQNVIMIDLHIKASIHILIIDIQCGWQWRNCKILVSNSHKNNKICWNLNIIWQSTFHYSVRIVITFLVSKIKFPASVFWDRVVLTMIYFIIFHPK